MCLFNKEKYLVYIALSMEEADESIRG